MKTLTAHERVDMFFGASETFIASIRSKIDEAIRGISAP